MPKQEYCCLCQRRCKLNSRRHIPPGIKFRRYIKRITGKDCLETDVLCNSCTARVYRSLPTQDKVQLSRPEPSGDAEYLPQQSSTTVFNSPKSISLQIPSTPRTHKYCIVCRRDGSRRLRLVQIPQAASTHAFIQTGIFVYADNRCCSHHLELGFFNRHALKLIASRKDQNWFSRSDICQLVTNIRQMMTANCSHLNFDNPAVLTSEDYFTLTGLNKEQFQDLSSSLRSLHNSKVRSIRTCIASCLMKLRTGLSNKVISVLLGLEEAQIQRSIASVRKALMNDFVPLHLGFEHISHDEFCRRHTTETASKLFGTNINDAITVLDGTYIYIQKSADYSFQRRSYSIHKNRPLLKPMMIVGTDGYILDVIGPYFADCHNNDAAITKHLLLTNNSAKNWFQENDILIVDRGFQDAVDFLEEERFKVKMPFYLKKGSKQHSTEEANLSRLITRVRWVVESANGRIKQWKFLAKTVPNTLVPAVGDFVRIVCSLCNAFRDPLTPVNDQNSPLIEKMLQKLLFLQENNLIHKRTLFKELQEDDPDLDNFSKLSMESLRDITLGVYQVKQAPSYSKEHMCDGSYNIMIHKENQNIVKVKIQSRHVKSVTHTLWIEFDPNDFLEPITSWYCTCKVGARVVGCCSHIASVLWFLGYERQQNNPTRAVTISTDTILDASEVDLDYDEEE